MTKTNRVAAACGVMLLGAMAGSYKSESTPAATIINDPQPTPELAPLSPPPPAEPKESTVAHEAPAVEVATKPRPPVVPPTEDADATPPTPAVVEWLTWPEARALSKETGRPVLVLQRFRNQADDLACLPCQRLKRTLEDPATLEAFAAMGIPCIGYADEWQKGETLKAPMIALVPAASGAKAPVRSLSNFHVAPASDFLADIKAWTDAPPK